MTESDKARLARLRENTAGLPVYDFLFRLLDEATAEHKTFELLQQWREEAVEKILRLEAERDAAQAQINSLTALATEHAVSAATMRAERDAAIAALRRIENINNGPDQASPSWRCEEAAAIARDALATKRTEP